MENCATEGVHKQALTSVKDQSGANIQLDNSHPSSQQANKPASQQARKPESLQASKPASQQDSNQQDTVWK